MENWMFYDMCNYNGRPIIKNLSNADNPVLTCYNNNIIILLYRWEPAKRYCYGVSHENQSEELTTCQMFEE